MRISRRPFALSTSRFCPGSPAKGSEPRCPLPAGWAPAEEVADLRSRLSEITGLVRGDGDAAFLEVPSAVIVYVAAHPERRRIEQAVIGAALREEYGRRCRTRSRIGCPEGPA